MTASAQAAPAADPTPRAFGRRWTKTEDRRLLMLWGELPLAKIAEALDRAIHGVYWRAGAIGLRRGIPQGKESVSAAAKRTGFCAETLKRMLLGASVPIHRGMSINARRFDVVDPAEVDRVVDEWNETEIVSHAARRLGVHRGTLVAWLEESKIEMPRHPGAKRIWRLPTKIIDAVVAKRKSRETVMGAAARVGMSARTLRWHLRKAAVRNRGGRCWYVETVVVDRVVAGARKTLPKLGSDLP